MMRYRNTPLLVGVVGAIVIVFATIATTAGARNVEAGSTIPIQTKVYKTTDGNVLEVVKVPGVGTCIITPVGTECKWK